MRGVWIFLFSILLVTAKGQDEISFGTLPKISLSSPISSKIKMQNNIESRFLQYNSGQEERTDFAHILTDIATFFSFKMQSFQKVNFGYTIRFRDGIIFHRLSEHYNIIQSFDNFRLAHRIGLDQTVADTQAPEFRLRYRLSFERSLSGNVIDAREFYLKLANEYLYATKKNKSVIEIRLVPQIGFEITAKSKVELGIDYRLKDLFHLPSDDDFWLRITWYRTLSWKK